MEGVVFSSKKTVLFSYRDTSCIGDVNVQPASWSYPDMMERPAAKQSMPKNVKGAMVTGKSDRGVGAQCVTHFFM